MMRWQRVATRCRCAEHDALSILEISLLYACARMSSRDDVLPRHFFPAWAPLFFSVVLDWRIVGPLFLVSDQRPLLAYWLTFDSWKMCFSMLWKAVTFILSGPVFVEIQRHGDPYHQDAPVLDISPLNNFLVYETSSQCKQHSNIMLHSIFQL
jgi:hypothetical protein